VSWWAPAPAIASTPAAHDLDTDVQALLDHRISEMWAEQRALLARPGVAPGTLAATQTVLRHLLRCHSTATAGAPENLDALTGGSVAVLAQFAAVHAPDGPVEQPSLAGQAEVPVTASAVTPQRRSPPATASDDSNGGANQKVLKVAQDKIDRLMDLIGEMVVAKNALPYLAARAEEVFAQRELAREIKAQYAVINRIAEEMQHAIMQVRMLPVGTIFQRFGRLVRDLSKKLGKDVQLVIEGEDTEADKNVIESLADPLIHILRNSLDHGIELPEVRRAAGKPAQAVLRVSARQEGDRVYLDISDDGVGIDTDRVRAKAIERGLIPADRADTLSEAEAAQLIFLPGFSTADAISDLSGRGVGMDVVRNAVERVNGTVELASVRGQGTTVRLALPLSMAVTNVMMIEAGGRRFGVPMDLIVETVRVPADSIHHFKQSRTTVLRGRIVPLRALHELLALDATPRANTDGELAVLVVRLGQDNVGLLVDDFDGTSDIILKPLEGVLGGMTGFAGTALMGDGSVLMILNPKELV
jgi:two-component system chemotaxis sensor kinase CheA